jgi:hypothetical protein
MILETEHAIFVWKEKNVVILIRICYASFDNFSIWRIFISRQIKNVVIVIRICDTYFCSDAFSFQGEQKMLLLWLEFVTQLSLWRIFLSRQTKHVVIVIGICDAALALTHFHFKANKEIQRLITDWGFTEEASKTNVQAEPASLDRISIQAVVTEGATFCCRSPICRICQNPTRQHQKYRHNVKAKMPDLISSNLAYFL